MGLTDQVNPDPRSALTPLTLSRALAALLHQVLESTAQAESQGREQPASGVQLHRVRRLLHGVCAGLTPDGVNGVNNTAPAALRVR